MGMSLKFLSLTLLILQLSCGSSGGSPTSATGPMSPPPDPHTKGAEAPAPPSVEDACPWDLGTHVTTQKYQALGVAVQLDCDSIAPKTSLSYRYTREEFHRSLDFLSAAFEGVKEAEVKPAVIRIGAGAFHDANTNMIQIRMADSAEGQGFAQYIKAVLQLMKIERDEFKGHIRFNYSEIAKHKNKDGKVLDDGAQFMWAPAQDVVEKDLAGIRKYKKQILSLQSSFPDIVLFHGNFLGYYDINRWSGSYHFALDAGTEANERYFSYLAKFTALNSVYQPISVQARVELGEALTADFERSEYILEMGFVLHDLLADKDLNEVVLMARTSVTSSISDNKLRLSCMKDGYNKKLTIANLYDGLGRPQDIEFIKSCLMRQDFGKSFTATCLPGGGR